MKTDDLIRTLAQDLPRSGPAMGKTLAWASLAGLALAALTFFATIGVRADIETAVQSYRFLSKFVITAILAATGLYVLDRLVRPGALLRRDLLVLLGAPALLAALATLEALVLDPARWASVAMGTNSLVCLTFVPLIGIGPLIAMLLTLRRGAPTRPGLAGAVAGLVAGGMAASFYAAHCPDDSPFFVAIWYTLAISMLVVVGAALGRLFARF